MGKIINGIKLKTVAKEWDVYFDMALEMLEEIMKNNEKGKTTVMIVPVGPTDQYPILARLVNTLGVSLKNVWFFNMDEYMMSPTEMIDPEHAMSFKKRMQDGFYSLVRDDLVMPESQRLFPTVGREAEFDALIEELGGVDLCLGGLGINGHIAFNEPPEVGDNITAEEFASLPTRVLPISRETKTINAFGYNKGDLQGMPQWCVTIGMKQILSSKKVYIALNRVWQNGPFKHALLGEQTANIPASLLQRCENVTYCGIPEVMNGIV